MAEIRRIPANKGKPTGKKWPLNKPQVLRLLDYFAKEHRYLNRLRNLVIFAVAVNSALRGVDLVQLKVEDVSSDTKRSTLSSLLFSKRRSAKAKNRFLKT